MQPIARTATRLMSGPSAQLESNLLVIWAALTSVMELSFWKGRMKLRKLKEGLAQKKGGGAL